jgi:hypothetical protein
MLPEQVNVAVLLYTCIPEVLGPNFRLDTDYLERDFSWFSSDPGGKCRNGALTKM